MKKPLRNGILAYHPSKSEQAQELLKALKQRINLLHPGFQFWAVGEPTVVLEENFNHMPPNQEFEIIPILLFPGQHYRHDVQALAEKLQSLRTDIRVRVAPCLLEREHFVDAVLNVF